jgi:hypothetical protein
MSHVVHHAILITTWKEDLAEAALVQARMLHCQVLGPIVSEINAYWTLLVCPDGGGESWDISYLGDSRRARMREWLLALRFEDGSSPIEWCEIAYGSDDRRARVVTSEWNALADIPNEPPTVAEPAVTATVRTISQLPPPPDITIYCSRCGRVNEPSHWVDLSGELVLYKATHTCRSAGTARLPRLGISPAKSLAVRVGLELDAKIMGMPPVGDSTASLGERADRYPMCADRPVQLECRMEDCIFYAGAGSCSNVSPAISLFKLKPNGWRYFTCWTRQVREVPTEVKP